jgi:hypothetical protein
MLFSTEKIFNSQIQNKPSFMTAANDEKQCYALRD